MPLFQRLRRRAPSAPVYELLVLEGLDAGLQFTLDGPEVAIGRGRPRDAQTGVVMLTEPTVSSRQAVIQLRGDEVVLEHCPEATNPTLVNDVPVRRAALCVGDRIQVGRDVLELRTRGGIVLGRLDEAMTESRQAPLYQPEAGETTRTADAEQTQVRRADVARGRLTVVRGLPELEGRSFSLAGEKTSIGRHPGCDVVIPEPGVSRNHAELFWSEGALYLRHCSATNPTFVDGVPLEGTERLDGGEEIQLADRVVLRLELEGATRAAAPPAAPAPEPGLATIVEDQVRRGQEIERQFGVEGSFLDIDVVDSYGLKAGALKPEYIIASFERFRELARGIIEEFDGDYLNSNGDELMSFFESPHQAVRAASALLTRLAEFNAKENLLGLPFRVRQGIHSGHCLVDRRRGIAYSDVLDVAGHLQKHADTDGLLISEHTLSRLPDGLPFEPADPLPKEKIPTWRLAGPID